MSEMTNEEIAAEFETLFGGAEPEEETAEEQVEEAAASEEDGLETTTEDEEEQAAEEPEESAPEPTSADSQQARQNHAFAEQRLTIKKQNDFIKSIGKLMGFDESASFEDIQTKAAEVLLEKQSKEQGIPVEFLQRLERAESLIQENAQIKLERKVSEDFTDLINEHSLSDEEVSEFTDYLIDNGKNPMLNQNVDIRAEYLKLHMNDIIAKHVNAALEKESARQKKVDAHSASASPNSPGDKDEKTISTVKDLDDLFNDMDL